MLSTHSANSSRWQENNLKDANSTSEFYTRSPMTESLPEVIMESAPLISIYMPTWNREALAIRAVKSVLRQDYENWELIIVDDCSPTFLQLSQFIEQQSDSRIKFIRNIYNSGACAVRNQAINLASGKFITGIDDDDEWLPHRLSSFLKKANKLKENAFFYADDFICDKPEYNALDELRKYPKPEYSKHLFDKKNIVGNQVFTLTSRLQDVLFDTDLMAAQDYDAFYRLAEKYGEPLKINAATQILYVNHGEARITGSKKKFSGYFSFYKKHGKKFDKASRKYHLFTLYYIRNKPMSLSVLLKLASARNVKRYMMIHSNFKKKKF